MPKRVVLLLLCILCLFTGCSSRVKESEGMKISKDGVTVEETDDAGVLIYNVSLPTGYDYTLYLTDTKGTLQYQGSSCNIDVTDATTLKNAIDSRDFNKLKADCATDSITLLGVSYDLVNSTLYHN